MASTDSGSREGKCAEGLPARGARLPHRTLPLLIAAALATVACGPAPTAADFAADGETVRNLRLVANAGPDLWVVAGENVVLDGSGSSDASGATLTFDWSQTGGSPVTLADAASAVASFTAPQVAQETVLSFRLLVDNGRKTAEDVATVTVRPKPADGVDSGIADSGLGDSGVTDAGGADSGTHDAGANDAGAIDAGATDAGATDAGATDAGATDAGGPGSYDLVVTELSWSPSQPRVGEHVFFSAVLKNEGTAPTPDGVIQSVSFRVDGSPTCWTNQQVRSLAPGETVRVTASSGPNGVGHWVATQGLHSVRAVADSPDRLPNENNGNNTLDATFSVAASGGADAGVAVDSGVAADAGVALDAGSPADAGGPADPSDPTCNRARTLPGDSRPCTRVLYPPKAFSGSGGRVIDVTQPPFNAAGDGIADDTAALRAAYTWVLDQLAAVGWDGFFPASQKPSYILYLPDGTYRVRDTIIYNGDLRMHPLSTKAEALAWVRMVGQSREKTVIRLDDNLPAFGGTTPRAVVSFGKLDFNNVPGSNSLRNLTVDVGAGNPKAVGVFFGGANASDIENVAILAGAGSGFVGLDNSIGTILGYQRDLLIEGFDYGIRMEPYHFTEPTIEHATVRNQRVAGIQFVNGTGSLRRIQSVNSVPAVLLSAPGAHAVLLDSLLEGGASNQPAVKLVGGAHFFGRDVEVAGYGQGVVKVNGTTTTLAVGGSIDEYVSDTPIRFSAATPLKSLELPVQEVPLVRWEQDLTKWVAPATPGDGVADASPAIKAAMAAGSTVYFPGWNYKLGSTVDIPCTVREVNFLFTTISGTVNDRFRVVGDCTEPLLLRDVTFEGGIGVVHDGRRPLILQRASTHAHLYQNRVLTGAGPVLFGNMLTGVKAVDPFENVTAFLRSVNGESPGGQFVVSGSSTSAWLLGFKTEKAGTAFQVSGGARLEVLGGILNQYSQEAASTWIGSVAVVNDNSKVSVVACTNGPNSEEGFEFLVRDTQGATVRQLRYDDPLFPLRVGRIHQEIIPLYVSY